MSMNSWPASGHIARADVFKSFMSKEQLEAFVGQDTEELESILAEVFKAEGFPKDFHVVILDDEDFCGDGEMEVGVPYVVFQTKDIYVLKANTAMAAMEKKGISPNFTQWTIFG